MSDVVYGSGAVRVAGLGAGLWLAVRGRLRSSDFDLVHAFWAFPAGAACALPRVRKPLLVSCPGSDLHTWSDHRLAGPVIRKVLRTADAVTSHSAAGVETALAAGARAAHKLPICFDPSVFGLVEERTSEPVVAYAGRMTSSKGIFVLSDALRELAVRVPGLRFVACGTGPDSQRFEREVAAVLGPRAEFLGPVAQDKVADMFARCRVAVMPSFAEGMSATAIEALATGRPVVTTDTGEQCAIVARNGGQVVPVGDSSALADAIAREIGTDRDPAELRKLVEDCTPARVAERLLTLYASLAGSHATASHDRATLSEPTQFAAAIDGGSR